MVDTYMDQPPPSPRLAFALSQASAIITAADEAFWDFRHSSQPGASHDRPKREMRGDVVATVQSAGVQLEELLTEYHSDAW